MLLYTVAKTKYICEIHLQLVFMTVVIKQVSLHQETPHCYQMKNHQQLYGAANQHSVRTWVNSPKTRIYLQFPDTKKSDMSF